MFYALEMLEGMCHVLLCILEAVESGISLLEVLDVMRCMLEAEEGRLCSLEVLEMMRCVLPCMLEAVEGGIYLLLASKMLEALEMMRRVLLFCWRPWMVSSVCWR